MQNMPWYRFEQIKRYFHVSAPTDGPISHWYMKLSPLFKHLQAKFKAYCIPSSNVAVNEMMEAFTSRSAHTVKMCNKPIGKGYKIWALADHGYVWHFFFHSRVEGMSKSQVLNRIYVLIPILGIAEVPKLSKLRHENYLPPTHYVVLVLAKTLPYTSHKFNIFSNNLFTSLSLFCQL